MNLTWAAGGCVEFGSCHCVPICEMGVVYLPPAVGEDGSVGYTVGTWKSSGGGGLGTSEQSLALTVPAAGLGHGTGRQPLIPAAFPTPLRTQRRRMYSLRHKLPLPGLEMRARLWRGLLPRGDAGFAPQSVPEVRARPTVFPALPAKGWQGDQVWQPFPGSWGTGEQHLTTMVGTPEPLYTRTPLQRSACQGHKLAGGFHFLVHLRTICGAPPV